MMRRVARVSRTLFLLAGLCTVAWLPLSFGFLIVLDWGTFVQSYDGCLYIRLSDYSPELYVRWPQVRFERSPGSLFWGSIYPVVARQHRHVGPDYTAAVIPLWLLAFLCLAWPVTSFVIA